MKSQKQEQLPYNILVLCQKSAEKERIDFVRSVSNKKLKQRDQTQVSFSYSIAEIQHQIEIQYPICFEKANQYNSKSIKTQLQESDAVIYLFNPNQLHSYKEITKLIQICRSSISNNIPELLLSFNTTAERKLDNKDPMNFAQNKRLKYVNISECMKNGDIIKQAFIDLLKQIEIYLDCKNNNKMYDSPIPASHIDTQTKQDEQHNIDIDIDRVQCRWCGCYWELDELDQHEASCKQMGEYVGSFDVDLDQNQIPCEICKDLIPFNQYQIHMKKHKDIVYRAPETELGYDDNKRNKYVEDKQESFISHPLQSISGNTSNVGKKSNNNQNKEKDSNSDEESDIKEESEKPANIIIENDSLDENRQIFSHFSSFQPNPINIKISAISTPITLSQSMYSSNSSITSISSSVISPIHQLQFYIDNYNLASFRKIDGLHIIPPTQTETVIKQTNKQQQDFINTNEGRNDLQKDRKRKQQKSSQLIGKNWIIDRNANTFTILPNSSQININQNQLQSQSSSSSSSLISTLISPNSEKFIPGRRKTRQIGLMSEEGQFNSSIIQSSSNEADNPYSNVNCTSVIQTPLITKQIERSPIFVEQNQLQSLQLQHHADSLIKADIEDSQSEMQQIIKSVSNSQNENVITEPNSLNNNNDDQECFLILIDPPAFEGITQCKFTFSDNTQLEAIGIIDSTTTINSFIDPNLSEFQKHILMYNGKNGCITHNSIPYVGYSSPFQNRDIIIAEVSIGGEINTLSFAIEEQIQNSGDGEGGIKSSAISKWGEEEQLNDEDGRVDVVKKRKQEKQIEIMQRQQQPIIVQRIPSSVRFFV